MRLVGFDGASGAAHYAASRFSEAHCLGQTSGIALGANCSSARDILPVEARRARPASSPPTAFALSGGLVPPCLRFDDADLLLVALLRAAGARNTYAARARVGKRGQPGRRGEGQAPLCCTRCSRDRSAIHAGKCAGVPAVDAATTCLGSPRRRSWRASTRPELPPGSSAVGVPGKAAKDSSNPRRSPADRLGGASDAGGTIPASIPVGRTREYRHCRSSGPASLFGDGAAWAFSSRHAVTVDAVTGAGTDAARRRCGRTGIAYGGRARSGPLTTSRVESRGRSGAGRGAQNGRPATRRSRPPTR